MKTNNSISFKPPETFSDRAKALWAAVVPSRARSPGRMALVRSALEALDRADQASALVASQGLTTTTTTTGAIHINPAAKIEREARGQFAKIWEGLGLGWDNELDALCGHALDRWLEKQDCDGGSELTP